MKAQEHPRSRGWRAVGLAGFVLVGACGGGSDGEAAPASDGPQSFDELEFESPIAEFLGFDMDLSGDDSQAEYLAQANAAEEKIVACMAAEGFEYLPVDQSQFTSFAQDSGEAYFSAEWVAKYGFGITTQRFPQSAVGPDLVGYDDEGMSGPEGEFVDPNQEYVESLSPAEQEAYYAALYGDSPAFDEDATQEEMDEVFENWVPTGCQNVAWEETSGGDMSFWNEFSDELDDLYQRIEADPRVAAHRDEVTACLADEGLEFTTMDDLYERWETRLSELDPWSSGDPFAEAGLNPEDMTEEELNDFQQEAQELDADALATLAELQAEEIELAEAVIGCGGGPLNDEIVLGEIRVEFEQQFLDENRDRIAEFEGSATPGGN